MLWVNRQQTTKPWSAERSPATTKCEGWSVGLQPPTTNCEGDEVTGSVWSERVNTRIKLYTHFLSYTLYDD